jgi:DNA-directed RNA polymerase specialized sigma24 family protein
METTGEYDCSNYIKKHLQRVKNSSECNDTIPGEYQEHEGTEIDGIGTKELMEEALSRIDPKHAKAIRLKYYDNKTNLEIAEIMGMGESTISGWIGDKGLKIAYKSLRTAVENIFKNKRN